MVLTYTCRSLTPDQLTQSEKWDIHPFLPVTEPTGQSAASIKNVGILTPPLVKQREDGKSDFICGRRSFTILQQTDPGAAVTCRLLPADTPNFTVLQFLYEECASKHPLSVIESANFYQMALTHLSSQDQREQLFKLLGLKSGKHLIERALQLLTLAPEIQLRMMRGVIPENVARELLRLEKEDTDTSFDLICRLNLGGGKQKRLISLMRDVAGRESCSFTDLIGRKEIRQILDNLQMNTPQKSHALLQFLQDLHSPSLLSAEKEFKTWKSTLRLPEACRIDHSPAFEKDALTVSLSFHDKEQLEHCLPELRSLADKLK